MTITQPPPALDGRTIPADSGEAQRTSADLVVTTVPARAVPLRTKPRARSFARPGLRRRHTVVGVAGALAVLLMGVALVAVRAAPSTSRSAGVPVALRGGGTIISATTARGGGLLVRTAGGQFVQLAMAGKQLVTLDGESLSLSSVRPKDTFSLRSATTVEDTAQVRASAQGIVASSPEPDGDTMTLQLSPTRSLLIDIDSQTDLNGAAPSVASRLSINEADPVRVAGILDTALDEMTETWKVDKVGFSAASNGTVAPAAPLQPATSS